MGVREQLHLLNLKGHGPKLYEALDANTPSGYVLSWDPTNLGVKPSKPGVNSPFILCADIIVSNTEYTVVGSQFTLNAADYASGLTWTFNMIGAVVQGQGTAEARLYNLSANEYVTNATINTTNSAPTSIQSAALIVGTAAGNLRTTDQMYEVRLRAVIAGEQTTATAHFGTVAFRMA